MSRPSPDSTIASIGDTAVAAKLHTLIRTWQTTGQPTLTQFTYAFKQTRPHDQPLATPHHWALATDTAVRA